jgi:hypothetical protein
MQLYSHKTHALRPCSAKQVQLQHHSSSRALLSVRHQQQQQLRQHGSQHSSSMACRTSLADVGPSFSNGGNSNNPLELLRVTRDVQVRACYTVSPECSQNDITTVYPHCTLH